MRKLLFGLVLALAFTACNNGDCTNGQCDDFSPNACIRVSKDSLNDYEKGVLEANGWDSTRPYMVSGPVAYYFNHSYDSTKCYVIQP